MCPPGHGSAHEQHHGRRASNRQCSGDLRQDLVRPRPRLRRGLHDLAGTLHNRCPLPAVRLCRHPHVSSCASVGVYYHSPPICEFMCISWCVLPLNHRSCRSSTTPRSRRAPRPRGRIRMPAGTTDLSSPANRITRRRATGAMGVGLALLSPHPSWVISTLLPRLR